MRRTARVDNRTGGAARHRARDARDSSAAGRAELPVVVALARKWCSHSASNVVPPAHAVVQSSWRTLTLVLTIIS